MNSFIRTIEEIDKRAGRSWSISEVARLVKVHRTTVERVVWRLWVMGLVSHLERGGPTQRRWSTTPRWQTQKNVADTYEIWCLGFPRAARLAGEGKVEEARESQRLGI